MPRINRIRLHNIRYDKGNRIFDNLILNLGGYNGLLLLHNGGGKTLLLQLIAQVVCPNVPLQGRRLAGLVQEVPFTGHVLVEWLLDGNRYWYLLTGFCFAENLGSAHRDIDYFTYLTEYGERNPWDLESFPLLGEDGRTLNYRQLRERLAASGSRVRTFASDRRREYQRELQSYMIDPWEWEQVLITNSSEGGVGKFFESCSKTPQLLERLLIPAFDGVLGRTADGNDSLTRAFQQAAEELMRLPELKANKGALEQLSQRLPRLAEALEQVREAGEQVEEAEGERCSLYATLERGIPRLDLAIRRLDAARERCRGRIQEIQFQMDSLVVEEKKREKERLQVDLEKATMRFNDVRRDYDRAEESYRRHKAWRYWGKYQDKTASLRQEEERKRQLMVGREQQEREIQSLREKVWPLYRALLHGWRQREQLEKDRLQELQRELQSIDREIGRREARLQECREKRANLLGLREGFVKLKDSVAREMGREGLAIPLEEPEPAKARVVAEKTLAEEALKHWKETAATGWREQDAVRKELEGLRTREGVLQQEIRETEQQYEAWRRDLLSLRETLALAGVVSPDPVADPAGLKAELARQIAHLEAGKVRLEVEKNRLEERRLLFSGAGGPLPNADVARLQAVLEEYGVKSVTGASWLQGLDSDARRQAWVTRFPWLPYALIAEGEQIVRLVERGVELKIDLSAAVPVAARGSLQLDGGEETQVYFFRNKGLEPFVYPARAAALIQEMEAQGEELSEQINRLGRDMESRRQAAAALQKWQEGHRYNREEEWELVLREKAGALEQLKKDLEAAAGRMAALSGELAAAQEQERRMEMRATRLGSLLERLAEYSAEWSLEMERCEQERHLLMEEAALAGEINNLARQRESLQEEQERLKEQARATASRIKEMEQDGVEMFPPGYAGAPVEDQLTTCPVTDPACLKEYTEMAGVLKAKIAVLDQGSGELGEIEKRIREYAEELKDLDREIRETGVAPEVVRDLFRPVTDDELDSWRQKVEVLRRELEQAEKEQREAQRQVDLATGAYNTEYQRVMDKYGRAPADLDGIDLEQHRLDLRNRRRKLDGADSKLQGRRDFMAQLRNSYANAAADLAADGVGDGGLPAWDNRQEKETLRRDPGAPGAAVREANRKLAQCRQAVEHSHSQWLQLVKACREELAVLNNRDIDQFFRQLQSRTELPGWERDTVPVAASLTHVSRVIQNALSEVERRLAEANQVMEEMVDRSYRQAAAILDELKMLQTKSRVELRGDKVPLISVDLRQPDVQEARESIRRHLHRAIDDAVQQRQAGKDDDSIRAGLAAAVRSSALVQQLVPLEEIRFAVLKPRSDSQPYQNRDYQSWDALLSWSEGQRYAARFAVFVVLMAHLRQRRNPGQQHSVIIADNPFGGASSGHILEMVMAVARQTGAQLFCVTAHRQTEIMREFNVLYSLVPRPTLSGQQRMIPVDESQPGIYRVGVELARASVPGAGRVEWGEDLGGQLRLF